MQSADESLKQAFQPGAKFTVQQQHIRKIGDENSDDEDGPIEINNHLHYMGKADLPNHPVRVRFMPYSKQRIILYGQDGYQQMMHSHAPEFYSLQNMCRQVSITDCVETDDQHVYTVARSHCTGVLVHYDAFMGRESMAEVPYPLGCLSSVVTNSSCTFIYATNLELNCLLRFKCDDLALNKASRFGILWRPFDCCTSQEFALPNGSSVQFLFVSNLDAGICAFNLGTMEVVVECGDDLLPGAKYLTYDAKRSLLFVSCSCERLLRCYKFDPSIAVAGNGRFAAAPSNELGDSAAPSLQKIGDFLVANRKPSVRSGGPQCIMWDPDTEQLAVVTWSHVKGKFSNKVFRVNI